MLRTLVRLVLKTGWRIPGLGADDKHYHGPVEDTATPLVEECGGYKTTYTRRLNHRHGLWGPCVWRCAIRAVWSKDSRLRAR